MAIKVVVSKSGESDLAELVFDKEGISVGRGRDCDVYLKDPSKAIAPTHGYIQQVGGDFFYIDYGSELGSIVNGKKSPKREMTSLHDGDAIKVGPYQLDLKISFEGANPPTAHEESVSAPSKSVTKTKKRTVEDEGTVLSITPSDEGARKVTDKTHATEVPPPSKPRYEPPKEPDPAKSVIKEKPAEAAKSAVRSKSPDAAKSAAKIKEGEASEVMDESDVAGLTMALSDFSTSDLKRATLAASIKAEDAPKKRNTKTRTRKSEAAQEIDDSESNVPGLTGALGDLTGADLKKTADALKLGEDEAPRSKKRETGTKQIDDLLSRIATKNEPAENVVLPGDDSPKVSDSMQGAAFTVLKQLSDQFTGRGEFETKEQVELFGKLVAQTLDVTLDWLNKSLKGRSEFEGQFEAFVTMAFAREKNPIKAVKDAMEVRRLPLDWKSGKPPEELKKQLVNAFRDLTQHQIGLMEGVQRAINEIMKKLDPKSIEEDAAKTGGLFKSLGVEKRAWKQYALTYGELLGESGKLFNEIIFPNIRKGYLESHTRETPLHGKDKGGSK